MKVYMSPNTKSPKIVGFEIKFISHIQEVKRMKVDVVEP